MNKAIIAASVLVLAALAAAGGWWYWQNQAPALAPVAQQRPRAAPAAPAPPPAPPEPAIKHPLDVPAATAPAAPLDVDARLNDLFGRKTVLALFLTDDFARRVVATVDNLGRAHAASRLWPVKPADGRFATDKQGDGEVIGAANATRYAPYVQIVEAVDLERAFAFYVEFYPQLQRAYEELGYPGQYFNDRVVAVIDQLIATPVVDTAPAVRLPPISGPTQPKRPWVLYEFEDPALQSLSAGQKVLVRVGPDNARRLKARLAELRRRVATGAPRQ